MASTERKVIQPGRLRDQVYNLIREQLQAGEIEPGARLYEVELAARYGVSRTPVREALFQLAREGLLVGTERGYALPVEHPRDLLDRLEIHLLLDPHIARQAALKATADELESLSQAVKRMGQAHRAGKHAPYSQSFHRFRATLIGTCGNVPLIRCAMLVEDQYLAARNEYFRRSENRKMTLEHCERLLPLLRERDAASAEEQTRSYVRNLMEHLEELGPENAQRSTGTEPRRPPRRARSGGK